MPHEDKKLLQEVKVANIGSSYILELLDDELSARVVFEVVGFEHLGDKEGLQVLDRDLASLGRDLL